MSDLCGLIWLDPAPKSDQLWKAYLQYYTHRTSNNKTANRAKLFLSYIKKGYWASRFGYVETQTTVISRALGNLLYLSPIHRREAEADLRFLPLLPNGRLLDVGCGSGDWLLEMRDRGWQVEGIDFDEKAVEAAQLHRIPVKTGSLEQQNYPDNTFDAITLSHVIEHVPNPVETVRECFRILKPGGRLVLLTPNNESLSHRVFKSDWRGLEPPRHLHIFSLGSMALLLSAAGFTRKSVRPFIVTSVIYDSIQLKRSKGPFRKGSISHWYAWTSARIFKLLELSLIGLSPSVGDCVVAIGIKNASPTESATFRTET